MTFNKTEQFTERAKNFGGFLQIRKLTSDIPFESIPDHQLISDVINSKYHFWKGEGEPDGIDIVIASKNNSESTRVSELTNHKFYGLFDASKIKAGHYKQIPCDEFYSILMSAIKTETEDDTAFINTSENLINNHLDKHASFYFLDLDKIKNKDIISAWSVYDFFYAFLVIDRHKNQVTLVEFGLD